MGVEVHDTERTWNMRGARRLTPPAPRPMGAGGHRGSPITGYAAQPPPGICYQQMPYGVAPPGGHPTFGAYGAAAGYGPDYGYYGPHLDSTVPPAQGRYVLMSSPVCSSEATYINMYIHIYIYIYTYLYIYIHTHISIYAYICIYICIYTHEPYGSLSATECKISTAAGCRRIHIYIYIYI